MLGFPAGDGLVVIASNYGQRHHPAWYHNLLAHPEADTAPCAAGRQPWWPPLARGEQRAQLWSQATTLYPSWDRYAERAGRPGDRGVRPAAGRPTRPDQAPANGSAPAQRGCRAASPSPSPPARPASARAADRRGQAAGTARARPVRTAAGLGARAARDATEPAAPAPARPPTRPAARTRWDRGRAGRSRAVEPTEKLREPVGERGGGTQQREREPPGLVEEAVPGKPAMHSAVSCGHTEPLW